MRNIAIFIVMLSFVSCKKFTGDLLVNDHIFFKSGNSSQVLLTGEYKAQLKVKRNNKFTLKLKSEYDKKSIKFKLPKKLSLPTEGSFYFNSKQISQPFDLEGQISTQVSFGEEITEQETCNLYDNYGYCDFIFVDRGFGPWGPYTSGPFPAHYYDCRNPYYLGERKVTYKVKTTLNSVKLSFIQEQSKKANFLGENATAEKEYSFVGKCLR